VQLLGWGGPFAPRPLDPTEINTPPEWVTGEGDLRTLPCHFAEYDGVDGFYSARLTKLGAA
jgi:16S rRNA (cytosine967-C5)-methyltransferase